MESVNDQGVIDPEPSTSTITSSSTERAPHVTGASCAATQPTAPTTTEPHVMSATLMPQKGRGKCKFFATKNGCRAGAACPFTHDASTPHQNNGPRPPARPKRGRTLPGPENPVAPERSQETGTITNAFPGSNGWSTDSHCRFNAPPVDSTRVVSKPIPKSQAEDPREFQIKQLKRRFLPTIVETAEDGGMKLAFQMVPSDPDFPFEMVGLECVMHVPLSYPRVGRPSLEVKNEEMGREWQIKVEQGFDRLVARARQGTLLGLMNSLDKQLEGLLIGRRDEDEAITIIPNKVAGKESLRPAQEAKATAPKAAPPSTSSEVYTTEKCRTASQRREAETRQLEARLGRTPLFSKSSDGIAYIIPLTPRKHSDLPVPLLSVKAIKLFVPLLYPLQHCRVELQGVTREAARQTENSFERKMKESSQGNLMGHVNWLAQNMHVLATKVEPAVESDRDDIQELPIEELGVSAVERNVDSATRDGDDRSHIRIIPRPPEWAVGNVDDESSESEYSDSGDSGDEGNEDRGAALDTVPEISATSGPERGISLSFPSLELHGIEMLELLSLSITIKCERCKDTMDVSNLRNGGNKSESCKKCALPLSVGFRQELMHVNSVRAGYLDLEGCTVVDMLPSNFLPTCSECSTTYASPGVVSVRGESTMAVCRDCHHKMTFKIPEVKFLLVSSASRIGHAPVRKKPKETLGIIAGQELPRRGRCEHYNRSYRWFRFSCCSKVFACDRCHDGASDHPNEHANRMICGYCSREQNYRPEDCAVCHSTLVKKAGSGFWEGGKDTRDKARMSRKDPRKYKRRAGGTVKKAKAG